MDTGTLRFYELHPDQPIIGLRITPEGALARLVADTVLLAPDMRGNWGTRCPHGHTEAWPTKAAARVAQQNPADWCNDCWLHVQWWIDYAEAAARVG